METSLKNSSSALKSEGIFEGGPPNQTKRRRTDFELEFIPRAVYNDFYAELQLREEGFSGKVNRSRRKIKQRIDTNPQDIPESLNLISKAIDLSSMREEESSGQVLYMYEVLTKKIGATSYASLGQQDEEDAYEERTVVLTEAGIDILNFTYQNSIQPLAKPKIASPLERPIHYFDNNRSMFKPFEKTYRYGSLLNTLASTGYQTSSKCHALGNEMDKKIDQNHRASTLRYKQNFKASESTVRARGVSFRGRGFLDVRKGWAKASEYTEEGFTGDISDTSYANETDPISFVKELGHPIKPHFTIVPTVPEPIPEQAAVLTPIKENPKTSLLKSGNGEFKVQSAPKTADRALTEPVISTKEPSQPNGNPGASRSLIESSAVLSIDNPQFQEYRSILKSSVEKNQTFSPADITTIADRHKDDSHQEILAIKSSKLDKSLPALPIEDEALVIDQEKAKTAPEKLSAAANIAQFSPKVEKGTESVTSPESSRSAISGDEEWLLEEKKKLLAAFKAPESPVAVNTKPATVETHASQPKAKPAAPEKLSRFDQLAKKTMEKQQHHNDQDILKRPERNSKTENATITKSENLRPESPTLSPQIEKIEILEVQQKKELATEPNKTPEAPQPSVIETPSAPLVAHDTKSKETSTTVDDKDIQKAIQPIILENPAEIVNVAPELKHVPVTISQQSESHQNAEKKVSLETPPKKRNRLSDLVGQFEQAPTAQIEDKKETPAAALPEPKVDQQYEKLEPVIVKETAPLQEPKAISNVQTTVPETVIPPTEQEEEPEKKKKGFFKSVASAIKKSVTNLKSSESTENIRSENDLSRASIVSKKSTKKDADTLESNDNLSKEKFASKVSLRSSFLNLNKSQKSLKPSESLQSVPAKIDDTPAQPASILDKLVIKQADSDNQQLLEDTTRNENDENDSSQSQKKVGPKTGRYLNAMAMASAQTVPLNEVTKEKTLKSSFRSSFLGLKSKSNMKSSESINSISAKLDEPVPTTPYKPVGENRTLVEATIVTKELQSANEQSLEVPAALPSTSSVAPTESTPKVNVVDISTAPIIKPVELASYQKPIETVSKKAPEAVHQSTSSLLKPNETQANNPQSDVPSSSAPSSKPSYTASSDKLDGLLPNLPAKELVNEKDAETWLTVIQKVVWKEHKCDLKIVDFELHCCESGKNKPYKPYLPLSLRRILRVTLLKGSDVEIQCSIPRGDKEGSEFKSITLTFTDTASAQKWRDNLIFLSFGGTYEETIRREILILTEKSDKDSQKLVEKYMMEIFESSKRPCTVKSVQYNEFMVTNVLSSVNFAKIGNVILTNQDFVPRIQQVLVREQYSNDPVNLVCEKDPVDAAIDIVRSAVGKKKLSSVHVTGLQLKREDKGLFSSFRK